MAALSPGSRLGAYEVIEPIGKGGMGEVYRARDKTLGRDVAIKVLPEDFSEDEERLARFRREAQVLASLNHPNIAAIYGVESNALVLELVEGPTLAERITEGRIPVDEAIVIARQIAEALEAAHEAGVIHRDLKPANVKVQEGGTVKVLDFGLAKAIEGEAKGDVSESPTMTAAATRAGVIMGTAAYMSPEQARGKRVDRRADIWSFGVVVYEMLTGRRAFEAEDISLTLAEVMKSEPDWDPLPTELSPTLRMYLTRCLEKDPKRRVPDIGVLRLAMDGAFEGAPPTRVGAERRLGWPAVAAALVLGAAMASAVWWNLESEAPGPLVRFVVEPSLAPLNQGDVDVAISPDGTRVVYLTQADEEVVMVRALDELEATPLGGLGSSLRGPLVSPDGNWVGYFDRSRLRKVSILGGPPVTICEFPPTSSRGASWGDDGTIIFATAAPSGLLRVSADGGEPVELTTPDLAVGDHVFPEILPGGNAVLFAIVRENFIESAQIAVLSLDSGEIEILVPGGSNPRYSPTGHIVYGMDGVVRAVGFDVERLEVTGDPVPVLEGIYTKGSGTANFDMSENGSLVYVTSLEDFASERTLVWMDREGNEEALSAEPRAYRQPRISPDGRELAVRALRDIWIWSFDRETLTRLTFDPSFDLFPLWTPDGDRVVFATDRGGDGWSVNWKATDGTGAVEELVEVGDRHAPQTFSPDGTRLVFMAQRPETGFDLHVLSMEANGGSEPLLATEFNERNADISPDGRWLAYQSDASGQQEIYVRPFPNVDEGRWQVSRDGGTTPLWGPGGDELFYVSSTRKMTVVSIHAGESFDYGNPEVVFDEMLVHNPISGSHSYDISPDGKRFLMIKDLSAAGDADGTQVILVQNWFSELERLVPVDR